MDSQSSIMFLTCLFLFLLLICARISVASISNLDFPSSGKNGNEKQNEGFWSRIDEHLFLCHIALTISLLGVGWSGSKLFDEWLMPLLQYLGLKNPIIDVSFVLLAFLLLVSVVVLIESIVSKFFLDKNLDKKWLQNLLSIFFRVLLPLKWLFKKHYSFFVAINKKSIQERYGPTEEKIKFLLDEVYRTGEMNQTEYKYVKNIFQFGDLKAKEIMVPRIDMVVLNLQDPFEKNLEMIKDEKYTRFPVINGDKDEIIGMIHTKEVLLKILSDKEFTDLKGLVKPVLTTIETIPVHKLLHEMQTKRIQMAILKNEYGGTSGLVTMEDIIEEIVGEIRDEFDHDEKPEIQKINENEWIVDGKVLVSDINELLGIHLENDNVDTIGGWLSVYNPDIPQNGIWEHEKMTVTVLEREKNRYKTIKIKRKKNDGNL